MMGRIEGRDKEHSRQAELEIDKEVSASSVPKRSSSSSKAANKIAGDKKPVG
jgi:hypothetical protein